MLEMEQNLKQLELKGGSRGGGPVYPRHIPQYLHSTRGATNGRTGEVRVISLHYPADTDPSGGETAAIAIVELH